MNLLRIAQAQINPTVGDFDGNVGKIVQWIGRAEEAAADIVTFPELALCGYPPEDLLMKRRFLGSNWETLEELKEHCRHTAVLVGFAHGREGRVYNAAALLGNSSVLGIYYKIELPNYGVFDEKRYFFPGLGCFVFEIRGCRISVTICEDIWIPGSVTEMCAMKNGADIVLNISGSPFFAGKFDVRRDIVSRFATTTQTTVFYNNMVGGQDELIFDGGSMVVGPTGELIASARRFEEDLLVTDFKIDGTLGHRRVWNLIEPMVALKQEENLPVRQYMPPAAVPPLDKVEEIYEALVLGTRDYVHKNDFDKVVIGLSGGIDSALTAAIAVQALGREHVIGVTMPSRFTSVGTLSDAQALAQNLEMELISVPINEILQGYLTALEKPFGTGEPGVEIENLQARIRGNILMGLSNRFGWLVLTTGNKSETAVGYCTLYGDMAGGFAMLKDVPKTVVYELSNHINEKAGRDVIPRSVIERAPSAELRADQKDEDSLPPYSVLDSILRAYVEEDKTAGEIEGFDPNIVKDVVRMVDRNEYKRRQAPPGIKITPKAFGKDRRLPITNRYINYQIKG
ncbi:MAG: NAD+ synthase [Desulfomonilaceae bacterium]